MRAWIAGLLAAGSMACASGGTPNVKAGPEPTVEEEWKLAILRARTEPQLTRAIGAQPIECLPLDARTRRCTWQRDLRHEEEIPIGVRQELILSETRGYLIRVECALPENGAPRDRDSCRTSLTR